jgi:hypothetical protein
MPSKKVSFPSGPHTFFLLVPLYLSLLYLAQAWKTRPFLEEFFMFFMRRNSIVQAKYLSRTFPCKAITEAKSTRHLPASYISYTAKLLIVEIFLAKPLFS